MKKSPSPSPVVSVVMSCFNDAATVGRAIESIQAQTLQDWELIAINDGSTDGTAKILDQFARQDSRIHVTHQENAGLTKALICGCAQAQADLIARHDADDISAEDRFAKQRELLVSDPSLGFVACWAESFTPDGALLDRYCSRSGQSDATDQLLNHREGPPAHGTVMMRKSVYERVGGYRSCFYFGQDSDLWMRMAECSQFAYVPAILYRFLRSPTSISGSRRHIQQRFGELGQFCRQARRDDASEAEWLQQAAALTEQLRSQAGEPAQAASSGLKMAYLIGSKLVKNSDPRARRYLYKVLRRRPWHVKAWVRLGQSYLGRLKACPASSRPLFTGSDSENQASTL